MHEAHCDQTAYISWRRLTFQLPESHGLPECNASTITDAGATCMRTGQSMFNHNIMLYRCGMGLELHVQCFLHLTFIKDDR